MLTLLDIIVVSPLTLSQQMKSEESGPVLGPGLAFGVCTSQAQKEAKSSQHKKTISLGFERLSTFVFL